MRDNPIFRSTYNPSDTLALHAGKDITKIVVAYQFDGTQRVMHFDLSKQDAIRLAAELTSWCETGEFIQPKKQYCVVYKPNCYPVSTFPTLAAHAAEAAKIFWKHHDKDTNTLMGVLPMPEGE
jgi:hypothetical protein